MSCENITKINLDKFLKFQKINSWKSVRFKKNLYAVGGKWACDGG